IELLFDPAADLAGVLVVLGGAGHGAVAVEDLGFALMVGEGGEGASGLAAAVAAWGRDLVGGVADEVAGEAVAGFALVLVDGHRSGQYRGWRLEVGGRGTDIHRGHRGRQKEMEGGGRKREAGRGTAGLIAHCVLAIRDGSSLGASAGGRR